MPSPQTPAYSRIALIGLASATIVLGLASRRFPILGNYPGDALWATLVTFLWALLCVRTKPRAIAIWAFATALCVELSQLYHAPWIDQLRATLPGRLALGSGFDPIDLLAYAIGVFIALPILNKLRARIQTTE